MAAPDPVDVRLLNAVAETGRAAIHELAAYLGMDVREVAARLAALSTSGLPLVVGVECDPNGIRNALASAGVQPGPQQPPPQPSGGYPAPPPGAGAPPLPPQPHHSGPHSGGHPVHGGMSGPYQHPNTPYPPATPQGPQPPRQPPAQPQGPPPVGTASQQPPTPPGTWGPPASSAWPRRDAAGDQAPRPPAVPKSGKVGNKLDTVGPDGEPVSVLLVEVVDPADFLFSAAGHTLEAGQRAVVVHIELTNRGTAVFDSPPDQHLLLVAQDGSTVSKSSVALSSRPPHSAGVSPGETGGGHTVFVLPEETELRSVEWSPRPDPGPHSLVWDISDL
ncbi:AsnC family protein [Actinopolyspora xinjiangensis]|uniref:AsnC family protein n=1 Tax=Actinopolyspora xinjiangensis TaxID=405564 RepID=UPI000B8572B8|nr:AsnC family protein [Actinopolyspora xinjiangensis]